jgi:hypothetical protein
LFFLSGTYRYFSQILSNYGIETTFINTTDTALLEKTVKDNTKVGTCNHHHPHHYVYTERKRERERGGGKEGEGERKRERGGVEGSGERGSLFL